MGGFLAWFRLEGNGTRSKTTGAYRGLIRGDRVPFCGFIVVVGCESFGSGW
jgi:hypothetical protein